MPDLDGLRHDRPWADVRAYRRYRSWNV